MFKYTIYKCSLCEAVFSEASTAAKHFMHHENKKRMEELAEALRRIKEQMDAVGWDRPQRSSNQRPSHRLNSVINLIHRGATIGERDAAKRAYKRITGKEYIG